MGESNFGLLRQHEICRQLHILLEEKNIYLNPNLTLAELSKTLRTNSTYISRIINTHYHCNFRTLLKKYRITYSQKLLQTEKECSINRLAKQCGFLSRSTFYAAFREITQLTPAEYRLLHKMGKLSL